MLAGGGTVGVVLLGGGVVTTGPLGPPPVYTAGPGTDR